MAFSTDCLLKDTSKKESLRFSSACFCYNKNLSSTFRDNNLAVHNAYNMPEINAHYQFDSKYMSVTSKLLMICVTMYALIWLISKSHAHSRNMVHVFEQFFAIATLSISRLSHSNVL